MKIKNNILNKIKKVSNKVQNKIKQLKLPKIVKIDKKLILAFFIIISFNIILEKIYGASDPTLVNKLNIALKKIQGYLLKLAVPAAGVAIATGVMIRKFSFGDEEKMIIGKKVIINAIICYAIIISTDLIIKFVDSVM